MSSFEFMFVIVMFTRSCYYIAKGVITVANSMTDKELLKLLQKNGWNIIRIKGSHHILANGTKREIIATHGKDVPAGLLNKILKRTGLKEI